MSLSRIVSILATLGIAALLSVASPVEFCQVGPSSPSLNPAAVGTNPFTLGGIQVTTSPGSPQCKQKDYVLPADGIGKVAGLGVTGKTGGEIDFNEFVTLDFGGSVNISFFEIIVFYNGPEFNDPQEKGFVKVWYEGGTQSTYEFQAVPHTVNQTDLTTNLPNSTGWANISPMTQDNAGWFIFRNPFNNAAVTKLQFTAANNPTSSNNSDYALKSVEFLPKNVEPIPEPSTYLLFGLGLLGLGVMRRKRSA